MATVKKMASGASWQKLSHHGKENYHKFCDHLQRWAARMGYDDSWEIHVKYAQTQKYLAQCDELDMVKYRRIMVTASSKLLDDTEPALEATAAHELSHIALYPYTRLAERLERLSVPAVKGEDDGPRPIMEELHEREEEVVTRLELALMSKAEGE